MGNFVDIDAELVEPEHGAPAEDRLVSGEPKFRTWNLNEEKGGLYAGVWEATPGKWRIEYDEWEFCHILSGVSVSLMAKSSIAFCFGDRLAAR